MYPTETNEQTITKLKQAGKMLCSRKRSVQFALRVLQKMQSLSQKSGFRLHI